MVTTVRPKASDTPTRPMPTSGNFAASTAAPQPPNTSQKVPNNSATARLAMGMGVPLVVVRGKVAPPVPGHKASRSYENKSVPFSLSGADGDEELGAGALHQQGRGVARAQVAGGGAQVLHVLHGAVVHREDDVARLNAGPLGRALHVGDHH